MRFSTSAKGATTLLIGLTLAACGGGGGGSGSGGGGGSAAFRPSPSPTWASAGVSFDSARARAFAASPEFRFVDATCTAVNCGVTPTGQQSTPYALHGVDWAHSAGLTGAGNTIAIVDDGFLTTHREFSGKTIVQSGTLPVAGHGTLVASLAVGNKDGLGMHGVAPGASLHLTSFEPDGSSFGIANVIAGTLDAASRGAVAQNNSWGFNVGAEQLQNYRTANPGTSTATGLNALIGYGASNWQAYIDALDRFQERGVVVWALSNDDNLTQGDITAALPYFETRLGEAWIAAANGYFEVDSAGDITRAVRLSAACGLAARFCLAGDGITTGAWNSSNVGYASGYGTSFVAPQVSGAVALLSEAFPDLTPAEWTKRLLASADNSWFAAQGVPVAGNVDYGNGVTHDYSTEWGHGVLDIQAALSPIGSVSVLSGGNVVEAERFTPQESLVTTPTSFGDSLASALAPQNMAVFDALNRAYSVSVGAALVAEPAALVPRFGEAGIDKAGLGFSIRETGNLGAAAGGLAGGGASLLSMAGESVLVASTAPVGSVAALTTYGFAGQHGSVESAGLAGGGVTLTLPAGNGTIRLGGTLAGETGAVMGLSDGPVFNFGSGSTLGAINLGFEQSLAPSLTLFGRVEYGAAARHAGSTGFIADLSGLTFSGLEVGAVFADTLMAGDRLTLSLSQPLRIEAGTLELNRPVGRLADGSMVNERSSVGLEASGRQLDLGLAYETQLDNEAAMSLGIKYAANTGHVAGQSGLGLAIGYRQGF